MGYEDEMKDRRANMPRKSKEVRCVYVGDVHCWESTE